MEWDRHVISEGVHIHKAMVGTFNQGSGHNIECDGRTKGLGWT